MNGEPNSLSSVTEEIVREFEEKFVSKNGHVVLAESKTLFKEVTQLRDFLRSAISKAIDAYEEGTRVEKKSYCKKWHKEHARECVNRMEWSFDTHNKCVDLHLEKVRAFLGEK